MHVGTSPCDFGHRRLRLVRSSLGWKWFRGPSRRLCWLRFAGWVCRLRLGHRRQAQWTASMATLRLLTIIPAARDFTRGTHQLCFWRSTPRQCPAESSIHAAPVAHHRTRRPCPSRPRWFGLLRNECWPSSRIRLPPVAAAMSRLQRSISFRLPSNEAPSCGSEFSFFRLMHCYEQAAHFRGPLGSVPGLQALQQISFLKEMLW